MSCFELLPLSGGAPVPVPPGETVLGRGPLLGVSDKRVSRSHALLENCDGRLRLKSIHVNPVFLQSGSDPDPNPLIRDQWTVLQPGDTVSLLPGQLCYRVLQKPDQDQDLTLDQTQEQSPQQGTDQPKEEQEEEPVGTPRNSQEFEEIRRQHSPQITAPIGPQQIQASPSGRRNQSQAEEEDQSLRKSDSDQALDQSLNQSRSTPRPRVLPAWMMSVSQSSSSISPGATKTGRMASSARGQAVPSRKAPHTATSSSTKAPPTATSSSTKAPPTATSLAPKAPPTAISSAPKAPPSGTSSVTKAPPPASSSAPKTPPTATSSAPNAPPPVSEGEELSEEEEQQLKKRRKLNGSDRVAPVSVCPAEGALYQSQKLSCSATLQEDVEQESSAFGARPPNASAPGFSPDPNPDLSPDPTPDPGPGLAPAAAKTSSTKTTKRTPCPYGKDCYRKNPLHFQEQSHPGDLDYEDPDQDQDSDQDRPECPYGTDCYRKNPLHRKEFKHTKRPARKTRAAPKRDADEEDEDEYESSFIDSESDYEPPAQNSSSESEDLSQLQQEASHFVRGRR